MKEATRSARRQSIEEKMMGAAPTYYDAVYRNESERKLALIKGLQWYGFYFEPKGSISYVQNWLKKNSNSLLVSKSPVSINSTYLAPSIVALMKMVDVGWILSESEKQRIKDHFSPFVSDGSWFPSAVSINAEDVVESTQEKRVAPSETPSFRQSVMDFLLFLDQEEESWFIEKKRIDPKCSKFIEQFQTIENPSKSEIVAVSDWISSRLTQYSESFDRTDEDMIEAFDTVSRAVLGTFIKRLQSYSNDLETLKNRVKVIRQQTKKKVTSIKASSTKKTPAAYKTDLSKLNYQKSSAEYAIVSINPEKIIGKSYLITFNTKYCQMTVYRATGPEGFTIKGTTLYGWDETKSVIRRLRKPNEVLPIAISKTMNVFEKTWNKLTTIENPAKTGRIGEDTILLKVL